MQSPRAQELFGGWAELAKAPFTGITTDGHVMPGLFSLQPRTRRQRRWSRRSTRCFASVSPAQRSAMCLPVDSDLWRQWQNTELYVEHYGLRLDETSDAVREAVMAVLRASLSAKGYEILARRDAAEPLSRRSRRRSGGARRMELHLLSVRHAVGIEPWGWQLFGHHLTLSCFVLGRQMVLTPSFLGAEPAYADSGPFAGTRLFEDEERAGLR